MDRFPRRFSGLSLDVKDKDRAQELVDNIVPIADFFAQVSSTTTRDQKGTFLNTGSLYTWGGM